ncbi:MAG: hypothetical protein BWY88_01079 [Synergistetes bacterium ADurb.Bin520]|nr:MAG: hypothetical protein BWY88_01079 [Synergistetes bacterium ADurb.Bin520]
MAIVALFVFQGHEEVEAAAGDVGKGASGVHRLGGEDREDLPVEVVPQVLLFFLAELFERLHGDPLVPEERDEVLIPDPPVFRQVREDGLP